MKLGVFAGWCGGGVRQAGTEPSQRLANGCSRVVPEIQQRPLCGTAVKVDVNGAAESEHIWMNASNPWIYIELMSLIPKAYRSTVWRFHV